MAGERRTFCPEDGRPCYTPEGNEPEPPCADAADAPEAKPRKKRYGHYRDYLDKRGVPKGPLCTKADGSPIAPVKSQC